jgi:hypothetical protein
VVGVAGGDLAAGQADLRAEVAAQRSRPGAGNRRGLRDWGALGQLGGDVADTELNYKTSALKVLSVTGLVAPPPQPDGW